MTVPVNLPALKTWQPKVGAPGQIVVGADELAQAIRTVVRTPVGSVPGRLWFGSYLFEYVDEPIITARPKIVREVFRAIARCEPRVSITAVDVLDSGADGSSPVRIHFKPKSGGNAGVVEVEI
jgi:phage baseplate assembly protein W